MSGQLRRVNQIGGPHAAAAASDRHSARLALQNVSDPNADYAYMACWVVLATPEVRMIRFCAADPVVRP
jgi:hypothetical protein